MEPAEELRALELERTDNLGRAMWGLIEHHDPNVQPKAMDRYIKLMEYRAKITGLCNTKPQHLGEESALRGAQTARPQIVEDVERFMALTGQIAEEFSGGIAEADEVELSSHLDDHDEEFDDVQVIIDVETID
jgi:hypothetical protein